MDSDFKYGISRIGWQNLVDTSYFDTFIARQFNGSFGTSEEKQDFRLSREADSLVWLINKIIGPGSIADAIGGGKLLDANRMNTFTSTSVCSHLLTEVLSQLSRRTGSYKNSRAAAYSDLFEKLISRRQECMN